MFTEKNAEQQDCPTDHKMGQRGVQALPSDLDGVKGLQHIFRRLTRPVIIPRENIRKLKGRGRHGSRSRRRLHRCDNHIRIWRLAMTGPVRFPVHSRLHGVEKNSKKKIQKKKFLSEYHRTVWNRRETVQSLPVKNSFWNFSPCFVLVEECWLIVWLSKSILYKKWFDPFG